MSLLNLVLQFGIQLVECFEQVAVICTRQFWGWSQIVGRYDEHICIINVARQPRIVQEAVVQHEGHVKPRMCNIIRVTQVCYKITLN